VPPAYYDDIEVMLGAGRFVQTLYLYGFCSVVATIRLPSDFLHMPTPSNSRCGFLVTGRVQGVGFRWWTRQAAVRLGLTGTVRNLPDGRVEIHVAGDPVALAKFRRQLEAGPTAARVRELTETPAPPVLPDDFVITG
jgi:acylphosphatase